LDIDPQRKGSFVSGSRCLCQISSKSVKNCDRESADRQTDTHTDRDDRGALIICPMLCYSNGTDKNYLWPETWTGGGLNQPERLKI